MTELSLPVEYSITGRSASLTTSRMMWMLSASRHSRCVRLMVLSHARCGSPRGAIAARGHPGEPLRRQPEELLEATARLPAIYASLGCRLWQNAASPATSPQPTGRLSPPPLAPHAASRSPSQGPDPKASLSPRQLLAALALPLRLRVRLDSEGWPLIQASSAASTGNG